MYSIEEKPTKNLYRDIFISKDRNCTRVYFKCVKCVTSNFIINILPKTIIIFQRFVIVEVINRKVLNYPKLSLTFSVFTFFDMGIIRNLLHHHLRKNCLPVLASIHHWCLLVRSLLHVIECAFQVTKLLFFFEISFCVVFSFSLQEPALLDTFFSVLYVLPFCACFLIQDFHLLLQAEVVARLSCNPHKASLPLGLLSCSNILNDKFSSHSHHTLAFGFDPLQILPLCRIYSMHLQTPLANLTHHTLASFFQLIRSFLFDFLSKWEAMCTLSCKEGILCLL